MAQTRAGLAPEGLEVPIGVVAGAVECATLKSLAIEKLTETEVHSSRVWSGSRRPGPIGGGVEEIMQTVRPARGHAREDDIGLRQSGRSPGTTGL